ncbi:alpha/beta-hydrolase [Karstenula rhodostoma CBS 690.94]|uniref:Carboxylic ester hydrolase n=1 Tax=Karstenula rhodostoma CBS 690.94 TaxID=1392251 RepID=A0A9P4PMM1_9PLEO|nr:alpha/beta-hydrolase [Karstenula rhodostoma CBS 690.94]
MRFNVFQHVLAATTLPTCFATSGGLNVSLDDYGSFVGTTVNQTLTQQPLPAEVDAWLGIDYATQPIGKDRFALVTLTKSFSGTKNASQYGYTCVQDPETNAYPMDEACLNLNVYRPQGFNGTEKLPVLVWIHGGAFFSGSARSFDGASFVANSKEPLIVVTFNYRVNSLGFLPTPAFERLGLLNLGLLDQQLALQFVQKHISTFGGDAGRITIGGRSAGAHSVGIHLSHNYNKTSGPSPLFSQALLQSGSVTSRSFPNASYPLYQAQFSRYLDLIGCRGSANGTNEELLSCLRTAPIDAIQHASSLLFAESEYAITWPFQPTRGGPLLEQAGSISGKNGQFYHIPTITTNVPDEAKYYTPGDLLTNDDFLAYIHNLIPGLTAQDLSDLEQLYPDPANHTNSAYSNSPNSTQYNRVSAAVTDFMYVCPGQETAVRMSAAGVPVFKAVFATNNSFPTWRGIPHTSDTKYTWAETLQGGAKGVQYPQVGSLLHGYFADFVVSGNPNGKQSQDAPGWEKYVDGGKKKPGLQLRIEPFGNSRIEGDGIRRVQCEWWRDGDRAARLEK